MEVLVLLPFNHNGPADIIGGHMKLVIIWLGLRHSNTKLLLS